MAQNLRSPPLFLCTATRTALNDATESVVERTLYDQVYFEHELETAMKRQLNPFGTGRYSANVR